MNVYSFNTETLEEQATLIKNIVLSFMVSNEMIDSHLYEHLLNNYAIIVRKPTFFGNIWEKLMEKADSIHYIIVKQQTLMEDKNNGEQPPNLKVVKLDKDKDK